MIISAEDRRRWKRFLAAPKNIDNAEHISAYQSIIEGLPLERQIKKCLANKKIKSVQVDRFDPVDEDGIRFEAYCPPSVWWAIIKTLEKRGLKLKLLWRAEDSVYFTVCMTLQ